jgi:hypothetical protein
MAVVDGALGTATIAASAFSAVMINVFEWSGNLESVFFDRRVFGGATNSVLEYRGPYQFTGTISGFLDGTAVVDEALLIPGSASASLVLTSFTGRTYTCPAHIHNFSPRVHRYDGLNSYTCSFRSDGDVAIV